MPEGYLTASDSSWVAQHMIESLHEMASEQTRPSILFRPKIYKDGSQWCCLLGEDIMSGVVGFGESPDKATREFDRVWVG
uniref:Uncharacterized protein n=1 Tax=viral metagenome TaxID=1070528 RepID=A0A6M3JKX1_9ZZZZ